jgi:hypothetical protein
MPRPNGLGFFMQVAAGRGQSAGGRGRLGATWPLRVVLYFLILTVL